MSIFDFRGRGEGVDDLHGLEAEVDDLGDEADDVLGVVGAIGVACYAGAFVGGDLVLIDNPVEGGTVAETIGEGLGGDGGEREGAFEVVGESGAVLGVVENGVNVVEDVPFGDGRVVIVVLEGFQGPAGDVFAAVRRVDQR